MSIYQTDFLQQMATLLKEAFKFKKYKAMHPALAVFTGILMIPFVLLSFLATAALALMSFFFAVLATPVKYLHQIVTDEGKGVQHATQTVIYLISWPLVFLLYVLMSVLLLFIFPTYALLSCVTYIWSLGGFKFHLFINHADDIAKEVDGRYWRLPVVFIIVGYIVTFFAPLIHGVWIYADLYANYLEEMFVRVFLPVFAKYIGFHMLFATLYSLIGFAPRLNKATQAVPSKEDNE